jgi:solute carrier family 45 protein 1/2/4
LPAFVVGAVAAVISAILAMVMLPSVKPDDEAKVKLGGSFH